MSVFSLEAVNDTLGSDFTEHAMVNDDDEELIELDKDDIPLKS